MPGPVSDSYDPEFAAAEHIRGRFDEVMDDTRARLKLAGETATQLRIRRSHRPLAVSVEDLWKHFSEAAYPGGFGSPEQREQLKRAFYAGAFSMLTQMQTVADRAESEAMITSKAPTRIKVRVLKGDALTGVLCENHGCKHSTGLKFYRGEDRDRHPGGECTVVACSQGCAVKAVSRHFEAT